MAEVVDGGADGIIDSDDCKVFLEKPEEVSAPEHVEAVLASSENIIYPEKLNESSKTGLLIEAVYFRIKNALNSVDAKKVKEAETKLDVLIERILKGEIYDIAWEIDLINQGLYPENPELFSKEGRDKIRNVIIDIANGNHDGIYSRMADSVKCESNYIQERFKNVFCCLMEDFDKERSIDVDFIMHSIEEGIKRELFLVANEVSSRRIFVLPWNLPVERNGKIVQTCWDKSDEITDQFVQSGKYVYVADVVVNREGRVFLKIKRGNLTKDGTIWD